MKTIKQLLFVIVLFPLVVLADNAQGFVEGKHYSIIPAETMHKTVVMQLKQKDPGKIQVIEFFSYGCHWCNRLEPLVGTWKKSLPANTTFRQLPVVFNPTWVIYGKAFFTAETLGMLKKLHKEFFRMIHEKRIPLDSKENMEIFFAEHGVDADKFNVTYDSFDTNRQLKWSQLVARALKVTAVPTIVVTGPHNSYIASTVTAGGEKKLLDVVSYLVDKEVAALAVEG